MTSRLIDPSRQQGYAADVPLICDPVPGPRIDGDWRYMSHEQWKQYFAVRRNGGDPLVLWWADGQGEILLGARTEWPDAEFCAA